MKVDVLAMLIEAGRGMLDDYEAENGEGYCDCRPEAENAYHVCNACLMRASLIAGREAEFREAVRGVSHWTIGRALSALTPGIDWRYSRKGDMVHAFTHGAIYAPELEHVSVATFRKALAKVQP